MLFCAHFVAWFNFYQKFPFDTQQNDGPVEETPATKPIVGIIYPPPEVRNIVDKTASFVARLANFSILSMRLPPPRGPQPDTFLK